MELEDFMDLDLSSILNDKGEWQPVESHSWLRRLYITSGLTCFQELQKEKNCGLGVRRTLSQSYFITL